MQTDTANGQRLSILRAIDQGSKENWTSEDWTKQADQWEASGFARGAYMARRTAEKVAASEQLEALGLGDLDNREESLMLVEALKLLRPAQRALLRRKLKSDRDLCLSENTEQAQTGYITLEMRAS
jgi:hypothetical protein